MRPAMAIAIALLAGGPRAAAAQTCAEEAIELRAHLEHEQRRMRRWNTAWMIAYGAAAVGQGVLAVTETKPFGTFDTDFQETMYVGTVKATIATAVRVFTPLRIRVPAPSGDPCAELPALRATLADAGRRERRSFWFSHLGGLALNLTGAALLTYRRSFKVGATSFAMSFPVGPISAYTQPRRSWHRWRAERASWGVGVTASADGATLWLTRLQ